MKRNIRKTSKSRYVQMREYRKLRIAFLLGRSCEAHLIIWADSQPPVGRIPPAIEVHHVRGRTGSLLNDLRYWKGVCPKCHFWIGHCPAEARKLGLLAEIGQWNQTEKLEQQKERNARA